MEGAVGVLRAVDKVLPSPGRKPLDVSAVKKHRLPFPLGPLTSELCIAESSKEPFNVGLMLWKRGIAVFSVNEFRAQASLFQGTRPLPAPRGTTTNKSQVWNQSELGGRSSS